MINRVYIRFLIFMLLGAWSYQCAVAQDSEQPLRPVASIFSAEIGRASILDTYLTPITYSGTYYRIGYERQRAMGFNPERWTHQLETGVDYSKIHNPAGNHTMHNLMIDAKWGMTHRWRDVLTPGLQLMAGGSTQLRGGVLYNANNSNNVVSARVHWSLGLMGQAVYNFNIKRLPVTLRYQATLPVAGVFFSPDYDEAYYEIYLGNHDNLVHFGWWGNRFDMENLVTADLHLGNTILRVGYRNRIISSWINNINCHEVSHSLVLGIGGEWMSVSSKKLDKRTISSIYQ